MLEVPGGLALNPAAAAVPASSQAGLQSSPPLGPPTSLRLLPSGVLRQGDTEHLGLREEEGDTGREAGLVRSQCQGHWSRGHLPARPPAICSVAGQALRSLARGAELALSTGRPAITITLIEQTACHAYRMPSTGRGRGHCRAGNADAVCSCGTCMGRRGHTISGD